MNALGSRCGVYISRKRCNISVQDEDCYFDSLAWGKRCVKSGLRANLLDMDLSETEVYAGFDKASNDDLTAFVLVYRATIPRMGDKIIVEPYFFSSRGHIGV